MFEKCDSSSRQKLNGCFFQHFDNSMGPIVILFGLNVRSKPYTYLETSDQDKSFSACFHVFPAILCILQTRRK